MARTTDFTRGRSAPGDSQRFSQADADAADSLDSTSSARSRSYDEQWPPAMLFGAGIALGALLGASVALLLAPQSGEETRDLISEGASRFGGRVSERFDDARDDLGWYIRRGKRKLDRGVHRGRWAGQDASDRVRKGW